MGTNCGAKHKLKRPSPSHVYNLNSLYEPQLFLLCRAWSENSLVSVEVCDFFHVKQCPVLLYF